MRSTSRLRALVTALGIVVALAVASGCGSASSPSNDGAAAASGARDDQPRSGTASTPHRSPGTAPLLSPDARRSFAALAGRVEGQLGLAVAPLGPGPVETVGDLPSGKAWSTMKVPVLLTLIRQLGGAHRLSAEQRSEAQAAITRSDNRAALALFGDLEARDGGLVPASRAIQALLRRAGDPHTVVNTRPSPQGFTTFGQTDWSAAAATTFYRSLALGCLAPRSDTAYVLSLMRNIIAGERWGVGSAGYPPTTGLAFKGGWGPGPDGVYLVRQSAIVGKPGRGYAATIAAKPDVPGSSSFPAGVRMVTAAARWLRRQLPPSGLQGYRPGTGGHPAAPCLRSG
jgi:hypothetical protein